MAPREIHPTARITEVLDRHQPGWDIEWATGDELRDFARALRNDDPELSSQVRQHVRTRARERLKASVGNRVFHRVLNAALEAGIVGLPETE